MRRVFVAISIVTVAVLAQGCLLGRSLYYSEEPASEQEVNATDVDAGAAQKPPDDKAHAAADGGPNDPPSKSSPDAATPDTGPGPVVGDGKPRCAGGTANERENNDSVGGANLLTIGKTCGALTLGDTDWFTIDFGQQGMLRVAFAAEGDGRLLAQSNMGGITFAAGSGSDLNFTTNGKWNLRVVSDTGSKQAYTIVRQ